MSNNIYAKTILILAANPTNTSRLRLDKEVREIDEGLRRSNKREQFKLEQKWAVGPRDFYRAILDYQPQIIHFSGHGTGEEGIVLEDETGQLAIVPADALKGMFEVFAQNGVECVVLNACFSKVQAEAISQHINYAIGMSQAIGDKAAIDFAVAFYDALAAGQDVESAFKLARTQLICSNEHLTPQLKKKEVIIPAKSNFTPPNPYQGLFAFGEKDEEFFFGREKFVMNLVEVTHKQTLVAVIGSSGSGKSSVVFAGLIPRLRIEGTWLIESFRPSKQPFYQLASALIRQLEPELGETESLLKAGELRKALQERTLTLQQIVSRILEMNPKKKFLLVADQFEELYTLCQDKNEQQLFVDTLLETLNQKTLTLVLTLRADFCDHIVSYLPFSNVLQQFPPQFLGAMEQEDLRAAIEQPAQKLKVQLQIHLTERILNNVGQEPGNLPLLEFALTELWNQQNNYELTHQAYEKIGGVKQALVMHAEEVYSRLSHIKKKQTQRIFLSLVHLSEGTDNTRRVASIAEVGKENWNTVTYLAGSQARLVVTGRNDKSGEETVEVVHEALIREWKRLREWINKDREKLIQKRKIESAAVEWHNKARLKDYLLLGKQLNDAITFQKEQGVNLELFDLFLRKEEDVDLGLSDLAFELVQKSIRYKNNNRLKLIEFIFLPIVFLTIFIVFITISEIRISELRSVVEKAKGHKESPARISALQELVKDGVPLENISLQNAKLSGANLSGADLFNAYLSGADLCGVKLSGAYLSGADLSGANLSGANLSDANLSGVKLSGVKLSGVKLSGVNLSGAKLTCITDDDNALKCTNLGTADLSGADLSGADLSGAYLSDANLSNANLSNANLSNANLYNADISGTNLEHANFSSANLYEVNLSSTNLFNVSFKEAMFGCVKKIKCTNFCNAKNLKPEQVKQANNWQDAVYDAELRNRLGQ